MVIYTPPVDQLEDLINQPKEREWLELKSWLDLTDNLQRAACARHLAAIANYGGGYLIFGFEDDGTRCTPKDDVRVAYSHDVIAGIVARYLQPKFQCEVSFLEADVVEHPIVWVPPHSMSPVISKADGPQDAKGIPQGIRAGVVYIRTPKPESEPATTPEHYEKLIQRCVLARRDELLSMFSVIMSGASVPQRNEPEKTARRQLEVWHKTMQRAALAEAQRSGIKLRYPLADNFLQLSYMLRHANGETLLPVNMMEIVGKLNAAVRDTVRYGWSMFYPFTREEIMPRPMTDEAIDDGDTEFLQMNLFDGGQTDRADFWRMTPDGRVSLLRGFSEDRFERVPFDVPTAKKWFDPWLHVRDITELVRHARAFAEEFDDVREVCFRLEWKGLKGRVIGTISDRYYSQAYTCHSDGRTIHECFALAEMIGNLPAVAARLFAPVYRMFNPNPDSVITPEYVAREIPHFIVQGT